MIMGEDQWFQPTIRNRLDGTIVLTNFNIQYGKFYDIKNPYNETSSAQGDRIRSREELTWGHCGRQWSPTGTEGHFEIQEYNGEVIAKIYWSCPYGSPENTLRKDYVAPGYIVAIDGFSFCSGALGKGTITVVGDLD